MNNYYAVIRSGPCLKHYGTGTGTAKSNHKYIERIPIAGGGYRYLYTMDEVRAYHNGDKNMKKRDERDDATKHNDLKESVGRIVNKAKETVDNVSGKTAKKNIKKYDDLRITYAKTQGKYYEAGNTGPGYQEARAGNELYQRKVKEARKEYKKSPLGRIDKASAKAKKALHSVQRKVSEASAKVADRQEKEKSASRPFNTKRVKSKRR